MERKVSQSFRPLAFAATDYIPARCKYSSSTMVGPENCEAFTKLQLAQVGP